ncbi:uncharacterized protein B0T23DRAFT_174304 [Neurospora hispaniola]|uniref:Uncharacterized protein n=1 Tax=Neurospora hispaniola TaxID=588809 RepID=A0AAJ0MQR9_9PEZI|nr:hypothetical protein B0T23DRAFT_174304 [Neurospora hispaniola]
MSGFPFWVVFTWNGVLGVLSAWHHYHVLIGIWALFWVFPMFPLRRRRATALRLQLLVSLFAPLFLVSFFIFIPPHVYFFIFRCFCMHLTYLSHAHAHIYGDLVAEAGSFYTTKTMWWLLNGHLSVSNLCVEYPSWRKKKVWRVCVVGLTNLKTYIGPFNTTFLRIYHYGSILCAHIDFCLPCLCHWKYPLLTTVYRYLELS